MNLTNHQNIRNLKKYERLSPSSRPCAFSSTWVLAIALHYQDGNYDTPQVRDAHNWFTEQTPADMYDDELRRAESLYRHIRTTARDIY